VNPMPFDERNTGDPFRGDFPGRPDHEQWDELEAGVQRQVIELAQRRFEPAIRHELLRVLERRRQPGPEQRAGSPGDDSRDDPRDDPRDDTVTQFDYLPVEVGFDTLMVRGELLITAESYDGQPGNRSAKGLLDAHGIQASEVDCRELHGRVVRLTHQDMGPQELADLARVLRARGFTASLSNITPTAPIAKAVGGPLPSPPGGSRPSDPGQPAPTKVAIIDTGITAEARADGWLEGIPRGGNIDPLDEFPLPAGDGYLDFDAGHGTFVAGIVQHVAPDAQIRMYRAIDSDGIAGEVAVACEMIHAAQHGADIINLSLGCQTQDNIPPVAIRAALEVIRELERAQDREILIVAAAGNYGDMTPCWPAAFRRVVSVAGLAPDMLPTQWSSRGFWVTCSTVGQGLRSTYVQGRESYLVNPVPYDFPPDAWAVWSGTSFAAPQITGALARLHDKHDYSLREGLVTLLAAGRPLPQFGQALKILPGM
jgi:Subtilase family